VEWARAAFFGALAQHSRIALQRADTPGGAAGGAPAAAPPRASRHATWEGIPPPPRQLELELPPLSRGGEGDPYDLVVRRRALAAAAQDKRWWLARAFRPAAPPLSPAPARRCPAAQVVGCGPAGLNAAVKAAEKGLKGAPARRPAPSPIRAHVPRAACSRAG